MKKTYLLFVLTILFIQAKSQWSTLDSMTNARAQMAVEALPDKKIYVWGGYSPFSSTQLSSLEIYNTVTNAWTNGAAYPIAVRGQASAVGLDGLIYSISGVGFEDLYANCYKYSNITNTWTEIASIPDALYTAVACTGLDGRIYVFGGNSANYSDYANVITYIYNPTTNSWTTGTNIPSATSGAVAVTDANGLCHVIGGYKNTSPVGAVTTHLVYNPVTNTWSTAANLPASRVQMAGTLDAYGKIHVVGGKATSGNSAGPYYNTEYIYDPIANSWSTGTALPLGLGETKGTTVNNTIYVTGGVTGSSSAGTVQRKIYSKSSGPITAMQWTGGTSTSWATASNWSSNLPPNAADTVYINSGTTFSPTISTIRSVAKVKVNTGATLTINAAGTLNINDALINEGTFTASAGTVGFNGITAQSIPAAAFNNNTIANININNNAGLTLNGALSLTGTLTPNVGVFTTNNNLTLKSSSTGTAKVATGSGSITGNVNMERYIAGNRRAYRFIGNPFSNSIALSQYADEVDITGASGGGFTTNSNNTAPSAYYYDATLGNGSTTADPGWKPYTSTSTNITTGSGFRLFVRGTKNQSNIFTSPYSSPNAVTITVTGTLNPIGNYVKSLVKGTNSGYNLISNPYASPINLKALTKTVSVNNNFYIWNARQGTTGGYLTYTFGINDYALPSMGAFFVNATAASQSITFKETDKVTTDTSTMLKQSPIKGLIEMSVHADGNLFDRFTMYLNDKANAAYDELLDAAKFRNAEANLYSLSKDGKALAVDVRPYDGITIPMGFTSNMQKSYTISIDNMNLDKRNELYLKDNYTGTYLFLQTGSSYDFKVDANAASQGEQRFELISKTIKPISLVTIGRVEVYPNPSTDIITIKSNNLNVNENTVINIIDINGKVVKTINAGKQLIINETINTKRFANGMYVVEIVNGKNVQKQNIIKQ